MFNNHALTIVTDLMQMGPEINDKDFMIMAAIAEPGTYSDHPNIYNASILMPPFEILAAWANGDQFAMINEYPAYLTSKDPDEMIVVLLAALTKKNVVLYIPNESFQIFGVQLLDHIRMNYGIICGISPATPFYVDSSRIPFLISKFYMMDLMEPDVYLSMYPSNYALPQFVIPKLAEDFKPFNHQATFQEYEIYFNGMNANTNPGPKKMNMCSIVKDVDINKR